MENEKWRMKNGEESPKTEAMRMKNEKIQTLPVKFSFQIGQHPGLLIDYLLKADSIIDCSERDMFR